MTAEDLRKVSGGVIGQFTPKEVLVDYTQLNSAADKSINLFVPKGKLVIGGYIKTVETPDTEGSNSATLRIKVGDTAIGSGALTVVTSGTGANVGAYQPVLTDLGTAPEADNIPSAIYTTAETEVKLTVGSNGLTAGKFRVGVLYI